jgi:predicted RNase H-like HicB family nuclease
MKEGVVVDENDPRIEEYIKKPYSRIIYPNDDGSYSAEILEFFGCYSDGNTADEAIKNIEDAARSWIFTCLDEGIEIPEPFNNQEYNGKIALRLPRSLHRQAVMLAEREGISLNQFLLSSISERVGREVIGKKILKEIKEVFVDQFSGVLVIPGFSIMSQAASLENSKPSFFNFSSNQDSIFNKDIVLCQNSR